MPAIANTPTPSQTAGRTLIATPNAAGIGGSVNYLTTKADEVFLIDEIHLFATRTASATNNTVSIVVNGVSIPINLPGAARTNRPEFHAYPRGTMFLRPSQTLSASASVANQATFQIVGRRVPAREVGAEYVTRPRAADNGALMETTVTHGVLVAGTPTVLIDPADVGSGRCVEITNVWVTGHNFNAAHDSMLLEFSNGTTHNAFWRSNRAGVDAEYGKPDVIEGQPFRGPIGYGVRVTATTNLVSTGKVVITYRLVPKTETVQPTGVGSTKQSGGGTMFWFYSEQLASGASSARVQLFTDGLGGGFQSGTASVAAADNLTITDTTQNWRPGSLVGSTLHLTSLGDAAIRYIVSNTATTITVGFVYTGLSGTTPTYKIIKKSGLSAVIRGISASGASESVASVFLERLQPPFGITDALVGGMLSTIGGGAGVPISFNMHSQTEIRLDLQSQLPRIEFSILAGTTNAIGMLVRGELVSNAGGHRGNEVKP